MTRGRPRPGNLRPLRETGKEGPDMATVNPTYLVTKRVDEAVEEMMQRLAGDLSQNSVWCHSIYQVGSHTMRVSIETLDEEPPDGAVTDINTG